MSERFTHLDDRGRARMVDVGAKPVSDREAVATAVVRLRPATAEALSAGSLPKGDALAVARVAGIMAAKQTPTLIPLCHPIALAGVDVDIEVASEAAHVTATARTTDRTGVEMEAMVAASAAALALYDMIKSVDRGAVIERVRLERKTGGVRGDWERDDG